MIQISDITNQVGRVSGSLPTNMPYKEMAGNCESLSEDKQQKISNFITSKQNNEGSFKNSNRDDDSVGKEEPSQRHVHFAVNKVRCLPYTWLLIKILGMRKS